MNWSVVWDNIPLFMAGLGLTLQISIAAAAIAGVGGLLVALMRLSRLRVLSITAAVFINVLRSIPPFALIIYVYYGIAMAIGVNFTPFFAGVLALSLQYAAWMAEVYRAGIQAVPVGQREAAASLGFGPVGAFTTVVLPQALRIVVPPLGNNVVGIIKDSSLVSYIGVMELTRTSQLLVSQTFRPFEVYTATIVFYLILTILVSQIFSLVERRTATTRSTGRGIRRMSASRSRRIERLQSFVGTAATD